MKALLIEFDLRTGKRAGNINPRDPALPCHGWQNLNSSPALEIRVVTDERDLSKYRGTKGVTVLDGKDEINAAIQANVPPRYMIFDMQLLIEHAKTKGIPFDSLAGKSGKEIAAYAFKNGLAGVKESKPNLLE